MIDENNYWDGVLTTLLSFGLIRMEDYDMSTDILDGHLERGYNHFWMINIMFLPLEQLLVSRGLVSSIHNMMAKE